MRSWMPRRPSDKVVANLFTSEAATAPKRRAFSLNWLAPAAIGAFSVLVMFSAHSYSPARSGEANTNLFFASITMENATSFTSATSLKTAFNLSKLDMNLEQNVWRNASFESTNEAQSHSSSRPLPVDTTNSLTR